MPSVQASFVKDVRFLVGVIEEMGNPFEEESQDVYWTQRTSLVLLPWRP